jgi:alkylhydroperoxidase/carboxymuconolactone decarboxylase family protein YurZ
MSARPTKGHPCGVRTSAVWLGRLPVGWSIRQCAIFFYPWEGTFMATGEKPVLEALADINAVSLARAELDPVTLLLVRIAALVAIDAPAASYLMHIGPVVQSGVTFEQVQDVLVAVAPITGAPRVLAAAGNIADALGIVIAVAEAEAEASTPNA